MGRLSLQKCSILECGKNTDYGVVITSQWEIDLFARFISKPEYKFVCNVCYKKIKY